MFETIIVRITLTHLLRAPEPVTKSKKKGGNAKNAPGSN